MGTKAGFVGEGQFITPRFVDHSIMDKEILSTGLLFYAALSGPLELALGNCTLQMKQWDLCLVAPGIPHRVRAGKGQAAMIAIKSGPALRAMLPLLQGCENISDFILEAACNPKNAKFLLLTNAKDEAVTKLITRMVAEAENREACYETAIFGMLMGVLALTARTYQPLTIKAAGAQGQRLIELVAYMNAHYATASLESAAALFNYSPDYISTLLNKYMGAGFSKLLRDIRMRHAAAMLKDTTKPIQEIARLCGYRNMSHFYEAFRQAYEMTPRSYREAA